jgi:dolichol-phosphate mannosyltransferase
MIKNSTETALFVVIPAFRCKNQISAVIRSVPAVVQKIVVVDDCCPEQTGKWVATHHPEVEVVFHEKNQGVGGAMISGYQRALELGADIMVKIDGDGQMDPSLIPRFIEPIEAGKADYTKGNRFFFLDELKQMPLVRLLGNAGLSFLTKVVTGYWNIMDPTNGYCAIHAEVLRHIPFQKLAPRYFFESDLLFRLSTIRAVVEDIPMDAKYGDEVSNLRISNVLITFPLKYFTRFIKRVVYNYFLRDFTIGSLFLVNGLLLCSIGFIHGAYHWIKAIHSQAPTSTGTIMIPVLLLLVGFQMILFFLQQDIASVPTSPIHRRKN